MKKRGPKSFLSKKNGQSDLLWVSSEPVTFTWAQWLCERLSERPGLQIPKDYNYKDGSSGDFQRFGLITAPPSVTHDGGQIEGLRRYGRV